MRNRILIAIMTAVFMVVGFPAYAAEGIDVTPVVSQIVNIVALGLMTAAGFVTKYLIGWLSSKAKIEDQAFKALAAERVNQILYHAIDYAEAYIKTEIAKPDNPLKSVQIDNFFVRTAVQYAMKTMSGDDGLIKIFGLTEEDIRDRILTRLNDRVKTESPVSEPAPPSKQVQVIEN